jgi:uncharacterized protein
MDAIKLLQKHYDKDSKLYKVLLLHSNLVAEKALKIAKNIPELNPDLKFIHEAAMIHDIGIKFMVDADLNHFGKHDYMEHGYLGRQLLEKEGYHKHALVCERHIGVGITKKEIIEKKLPFPKRDMVPISIEEKIISFADLFYTKYPGKEKTEKTIKEIKDSIKKHGKEKLRIFEKLCRELKFSF